MCGYMAHHNIYIYKVFNRYMVNLIQIDKSGGDILEKDYSIGLVLNRKYAYGINVPQKIKDKVIYEFNKGKLLKRSNSDRSYRMRLKVRFHTAIVIILLKRCINDFNITKDVFLEICNDYDGHFHEIKDMIYKHIHLLLSDINTREKSPAFKLEYHLSISPGSHKTTNKPRLLSRGKNPKGFVILGDIVQVRFQKPSLVDDVAMKLRHKKIEEIENYKQFNLWEEEVINILRK